MRLGRLRTGAGITLDLAEAADRPAIVALQHAAYAANRAILGVEPLPLQADYAEIFDCHETWIVRG